MTDILKNIRDAVTEEIKTEQLNIRLSIVRDCINCERFLFAHYPSTHKWVIEQPGNAFDYYYDMEIGQLELECASLQAKASAAARAFINWK